jgi:PfpI family intracellular protease
MLKREEVKPDVLITKVKADSFDAVVFIGGVGAKEYFADKTALKLAAEAHKQKKIVAAICIAPSILANAGVLKGKKATVFESEADNLKKGGADYTGGAVEVDGNVITANGPQAAQQFATELVKALAEFKILTGRKVVMIIAQDKFRDEELQKPKEILSGLGAEVTVAAPKKDTCKGMLGAEVKPDTTLSKVKAKDFDAVVFVGGAGAKALFDDKTAHSLAKDAIKKGKVLGAICLAPSILANAGVLKDKNATVYKSEKDDLARKGARVQDEDVVTDGKIVTANGPEAAEKFANALVKALRED